jgi:hypothetical protein
MYPMNVILFVPDVTEDIQLIRDGDNGSLFRTELVRRYRCLIVLTVHTGQQS